MLLRLICFVGSGLLLVGTGAGSAHAAAKDLEGTYTVKGYKNGKFEYEHSAVIVFKGGNTIDVSYKEDNKTWIGVGKLTGTNLQIKAKRPGVKQEDWEYEVQKNGNLENQWQDAGQKWKEVWIKRK